MRLPVLTVIFASDVFARSCILILSSWMMQLSGSRVRCKGCQEQICLHLPKVVTLNFDKYGWIIYSRVEVSTSRRSWQPKRP